jgi:membrane-bound metal-dependent hydrolase YbcI (DUF457 family)
MSLLPDIDVVPGLLTGDIGRFHNQLTHSLIVGLLVAPIVGLIVRQIFATPGTAWIVASLISYELHIIMDYFTGERGVMLFWPLTATRFSAPVKLFAGVQWGNGLVSISHLYTLFTESLAILAVLVCVSLLARVRKARSSLPDAGSATVPEPRDTR